MAAIKTALDDSQRQAVLELVLTTLRELNDEWQVEALAEPSLETRLFGAKSGIDSLMLVSLIAELEERISETFGVEIILADERAMSEVRSPFRRVGPLVEHIATLLTEADD